VESLPVRVEHRHRSWSGNTKRPSIQVAFFKVCWGAPVATHVTENSRGLQNSAKLVIVLVGRDLTIRRLSPRAPVCWAADVGGADQQVRHDLTFACDAGV
jgi:hypothetical protein